MEKQPSVKYDYNPENKPLARPKKNISPIKVALPIAICLCIVLSIVYYSHRQMETVTSFAEHTVQQLGDSAAAEIESTYGYAINSIKAVAAAVSQGMNSPELATPSEAILPLVETTPFGSIEYIRPDGMNVMNIGQPFDASEREYYINGIQGISGVWNNYHPKIAEETLMNFYTPLIYDGNIAGVITGYIRATSQVSPLLESEFFSEETQGLLFDRKGMVICSSVKYEFEKDLTIEKLFSGYYKDQSRCDALLSMLNAGVDGVYSYYDNDGEGRVYIKGIDGTDWVIAIFIPAQSFNAVLQNSLKSTYIAVGVIILLAATYIIFTVLQNRKENLRFANENAQLELENRQFNEQNAKAFKELNELNAQLEESAAEQESQIEEISALNSELEERQLQLEENRIGLERQLAVINATSQRYFCVYYIEVENHQFREIFCPPNMHAALGSEGDALLPLELVWKKLVLPEDQDSMREFNDIANWNDFLGSKNMFSREYRGVTSGWSKATLFAVTRNSVGKVTSVVYTSEMIHEQKEAEQTLASQLQEITLLNSELEERQAQLEEVSAEQESQLTEIQELNDQLKDNLEKVNIFAALSHEYASIHVADLDAETFTTIRSSWGMEHENCITETAPYWDTVQSMANTFVIPETRNDFLAFVEPESMRRRMEQEEVFSYRYAVIPDDSGNYVFEMTFVNIGEDTSRHLLVLGTKCIDKILQFEREEGQYNTALLNECEFYFGFDVTSGIITEDFIARSKYEMLQDLNISFPVSYDDFWRIRTEKQSIKAMTKKEAEYWTVDGLRHAFEEGKSTATLRYESDTLGRMWEATIILTQDMTSHRLHAVYICKDVTEMMKADLEVKQALEKAKSEAEAANNAKTSFLFNMSHDIRTPMNAIIGFRDLLEKHQEDPDKRADYLRKIEDSSNVLLSIINNVLEMARIEKGTIEIDELAWSAEQFNDTLYSIFYEMMDEKGITFTRQIEVHHPYVYCDPIKLREVFINILSNAYKYTNAGGTVNMRLEEIPSDREGYAMYRTTITDTGIGMSKEFLPHLFEEFSRENNTTDNKIEGTGLGMPIVKRLVDFMEGTIKVKSEKGVGSAFIVTIPHRIAEKSSFVEHAGVEIDPALFEGKRILLAEDNDFNAEIAVDILTEAGFIVDLAEDGVVCCEKLTCATDNYYNLILMDIQMPNMNGYEAARAIRKMADSRKANIPILAMTANAFEEDRRESLRAGMNGHLAKPIKVPELMKALAGILG